MKFRLCVAFVLTLLAVGAQGFDYEDGGVIRFESPEEEDMYFYQALLYDMADEIMEMLFEMLNYQNIEEFVDLALQFPSIPEPESSCAACRAGIRAIRRLLDEGHTWETLRDNVTDICWAVVNASDSIPELLCPQTLENYGPLVLDILNSSRSRTALEICIQYNNCDRDEDDFSTTTTALPFEETFPKKMKSNSKVELKSSREDLEDAIIMAHISDVHIDEEYSWGAPIECRLPVCCRDQYEGEGEAGYWGEYTCNTAPHTADYLIQAVADLNPDFVAYTGDNPPNTVWEETQEHQLRGTEWVADAFRRIMPGVPVFPAIGNHETFPTNLYYAVRDEIFELNQEFYNYWEDVSGFGEDQAETLEAGGYYTIEVPGFPGLRVLAYNSVYGVTDNWYGVLYYEKDHADSHEYFDMLEFMEDTLQEAEENEEIVMLLGHHLTGGGSTFIEHGQFMSRLGEEFGEIVNVHLMGHSHGDSFRMTTDLDSGEVFNVQQSAPAATCRTNINPSVRIYYLERETYRPLAWDQYHINLQTSKEPEDIDYYLYYSTRDHYQMPDLTPASFEDFVNRMWDDDDLYMLYREHSNTGSRPATPCTGSCKHNQFCSFRTTSYDAYKECVASGEYTGYM